MVLDPWNAPVCLTRVWCLYEVVHTVPSEREAGTEFHLALPASERARFVAAYKQFGKKHIEKVLAAFDAREAQAAMEADKMMIFRLIASMFNARIPRGLEPRQLITGNGSTPFSNHPALVDDLSFITPESILRNANAAFVRFNEVVRVALMGALTGHSWQI
ncbi:hypothetical protein T492DRAFT_1110551 [Pavlovales sp. CCMP2436]|nr:hypothetical protein T492DRAFT_1110551 [Pavlovales sp. CCMP2436]